MIDATLLDTLLSKKSDDGQEMKIWLSVHYFCVAATHGPDRRGVVSIYIYMNYVSTYIT